MMELTSAGSYNNNDDDAASSAADGRNEDYEQDALLSKRSSAGHFGHRALYWIPIKTAGRQTCSSGHLELLNLHMNIIILS